MKILAIFLFILPFFFVSAQVDKEVFVGEWIGMDKGMEVLVLFSDDGYFSMQKGDIIIGGKEFPINSEKGSMTYEINTSADPIEMDFTVTKLNSGEQAKALGIAKFITDREIRFALEFGNDRPNTFDSKNAITLKKVE